MTTNKVIDYISKLSSNLIDKYSYITRIRCQFDDSIEGYLVEFSPLELNSNVEFCNVKSNIIKEFIEIFPEESICLISPQETILKVDNPLLVFNSVLKGSINSK